MKVIIIGAGIAGLSAAVALRRAGHEVLILERSTLAHEIGAAIHVPPNASRPLLQWGFNPDRAMLEKVRVLVSERLGLRRRQVGYPWYFSHRVDLHNELKFLATAKEGQGTSAEMRTNTTVVAVDAESGIVTLRDSTTLQAHLIVAGDGVHSEMVKFVTGFSDPATPTKHSIFRFLIPSEAILKDPETRDFLKYEGSMKIYLGKDKRIIWYPCRSGQVQNFGAIHLDTRPAGPKEDWTVSSSVAEMLAAFSGFHPRLLKACTKTTDIKHWRLLSRNPLPTWYRSRLVLIGDAAHPMLPHQGQGGAQAIEDGAALGAIFSPSLWQKYNHTSIENPTLPMITEGLALFETVRKGRASVMQIFSSVGQDEAALIYDKAKEYEFFDFNFGYDVFAHCKNVVADALGGWDGAGNNDVVLGA